MAVAAGVAMVTPMACHAPRPPPVPWNPIPSRGMPWGRHGMPWVVPWPCSEKVKKNKSVEPWNNRLRRVIHPWPLFQFACPCWSSSCHIRCHHRCCLRPVWQRRSPSLPPFVDNTVLAPVILVEVGEAYQICLAAYGDKKTLAYSDDVALSLTRFHA